MPRLLRLKTLAASVMLAIAGTAFVPVTAYPMPAHTTPPAIWGRIIEGRDGSPIAYYPDARGEWKFTKSEAQVDPLMIQMLVAIENRSFWHDPGVDPLAILRAAGQLIVRRHVVSGASTLTMQVARLLHPAPRTLPVKMREAVEALWLNVRYSKRHVLGMWLSLAPFGGNIVGVEAASRIWFGKSPRSLTPAQAALLVALCRRPEALRPDRHPHAAMIARNRILSESAKEGVISARQAERAEKAPIPRHWHVLPQQSPQKTIHLASGTRTTLDPALNDALSSLAHNALVSMPSAESLAIMIVDARTRAVRAAYLGDFADPSRDGFVDLSTAIRSPGSALKPFLYGLAFAEGLAGPDSRVQDLPEDFSDYGPDDFTHQFMGTVTAATALRRSLNLPAVSLMARYGPARFAAQLAAAGIPLALPEGAGPSLPLVLGGAGINMQNLAALYAALATDGQVEHLHWTAGRRRPSVPFLSPSIVREIADILTRPLPGDTATGIAWKTGTSSGNRDDWAIGFDQRHVVIVWVGRPDGGALPGAAAIDRAVPILAQVFGLLKIDPRVSTPPPAPLSLTEAPVHAPLAIAYPPPGAALGALGPITIRATGGVRPLTFLMDGVPLPSIKALRSTQFTPSGPGFYHLRVIDADGRSIVEMLHVLAAYPGGQF